MSDESFPEDQLAERIAYLKRTFARGIGRTPSAKVKLALTRAAVLTAKAEASASSVLTSANDTVRLDGAAARARRELQHLIDRDRSDPAAEMTLHKYAALQARKAAS